MLSLYGHEATPSALYLLWLLQLQSEATSLLCKISLELGLVLNFVCTHRDCINATVFFTARLSRFLICLAVLVCYAWTSTWCQLRPLSYIKEEHFGSEVSFLGRQLIKRV